MPDKTNNETLDKYDHAIAYLTEHPGEIEEAWGDYDTHPAGCLFRYLTPDGHSTKLEGAALWCGCPTQIISGTGIAATKELTDFVKNHKGLPLTSKVAVNHLPAFAEVQRMADELLNRE